MDSQASARRWAATWTAAWRAHDVEAVVALYADDCVHRSTPFRPPHRGRQGVRGYVTGAFADERRVDDVRFAAPLVHGDRAWVEYWALLVDAGGAPATLASPRRAAVVAGVAAALLAAAAATAGAAGAAGVASDQAAAGAPLDAA